MKKSHYWILIAIFILTLGVRLYFSFSAPNYSSDSAYFTIRQMEHVQQTSKPLYDDELSFSGRRLVFPPLFGYALAFLGLVFPLSFTAKFFPNLFAASLVFFVYLIARKISKSNEIALFTAFISGFVPVFFQQTFNSISVYSLVAPLFFLLLYSFMNIKKEKWAYCYIFTIIILTMIHPSVILFVIGLWFYFIFAKIEGLQADKAELEIIIFSTFFVMLSQFIMFKKIFLFHGPSVIWQNIPKELLSSHFAQISIPQAVYYIGIIPMFAGIYIIYRYILKEKHKDIYLLVGFISSVALLLWLRLLELKIGLMFLGLIIVLLFAQFWKTFIAYVKTTRAAKVTWLFGIIIFILFIVTSVIPSMSLAAETTRISITQKEINALQWIKDNTSKNAVILATADEGNLVTTVAQRRNVIDSNFLLIRDAEQRFKDVSKVYTTFSLTEAINILNKYEVDYLYFSPKAKSRYNIDVLSYVDDKCFDVVYNNQVIIYKSLCKMEEIK